MNVHAGVTPVCTVCVHDVVVRRIEKCYTFYCFFEDGEINLPDTTPDCGDVIR